MDVIILPVLSVLLVNARASLLSGNVMETMTVGTTAMKMAACCPLAPPWTSTVIMENVSGGHGSAMETMTVRMILMSRTALQGSVRKMSSHVRMDTAFAAYGTVMVTMTVGTTVMSSVI